MIKKKPLLKWTSNGAEIYLKVRTTWHLEEKNQVLLSLVAESMEGFFLFYGFFFCLSFQKPLKREQNKSQRIHNAEWWIPEHLIPSSLWVLVRRSAGERRSVLYFYADSSEPVQWAHFHFIFPQILPAMLLLHPLWCYGDHIISILSLILLINTAIDQILRIKTFFSEFHG